jgi:hypothetical protein
VHRPVRHRATPNFRRCLDKLPANVQQSARAVFTLMKQDPRHPSVHLKKVSRFWSARVGLHHRALAVEQDEDLVWFWIGTHAEYALMIKR